MSVGGEGKWKSRIDEISNHSNRSVYFGKVASDYHWIELELYNSFREITNRSAIRSVSDAGRKMAGLHFAQTFMAFYGSIGARGRTVLEGRVRDALKSNTGFSSLYHEMNVARILLDAHCDVELPDLVGTGQCDIRFKCGAHTAAIECKSLSADAGRKIHRRTFYALVEAVAADLERCCRNGSDLVVVVTVSDRLPENEQLQKELRLAIIEFLRSSRPRDIHGSYFSILYEPFSSVFGHHGMPSDVFPQACRSYYGQDSHVAGPMASDSACVLVVRSERGDDHSAPQLEAMKKAANQVSQEEPAFIAVQYDEITNSELLSDNVQHKSGILSTGLFLGSNGAHVLGTLHFAFDGLEPGLNGYMLPFFTCFNHKSMFKERIDDFSIF
jgi:hypothetical protein